MIHWVFLDVGNVLLNEDPLSFFVFSRHVEAIQQDHPERSFEQLLGERERLVLAGARWPVYELAQGHLDPARIDAVWQEIDREVRARYDELTPLIPGAAATVELLSRYFGLGLIANQPRECRSRLARLGLLEQFRIVALSEEEGFAKPDRRLFERALSRSGVDASVCAMVGDRLDHDIGPAAGLGFNTVWIRWPDHSRKGWLEADPRAYLYMRSLERLSTHVAPAAQTAQPTLAIDEIATLARRLIELGVPPNARPSWPDGDKMEQGR
jgi:HAD superfamily hydrolase (TIGR01549 family)